MTAKVTQETIVAIVAESHVAGVEETNRSVASSPARMAVDASSEVVVAHYLVK